MTMTMSKAELRQARKAAQKAGKPLTGSLALEHSCTGSEEFSETPRGYKARESWARRYYELNGAPENEGDR